jgi:ClpP class serine protease
VDKIGGLDAAIKEAAVLGKQKNIQHKIIQNTTKMLTIFLQASFCPSKEFHQTRNWPRKL